jgi:hypothetical protein
MKTGQDIIDYNGNLVAHESEITNALVELIYAALPEAQGKVWHGHPVWFIEGNPVVGYLSMKAGIRVLFWSGQSFEPGGLKPIGKFKAAGYDVPSVADVGNPALGDWLAQARKIQWDYANIVKKKGVLDKLTDF